MSWDQAGSLGQDCEGAGETRETGAGPGDGGGRAKEQGEARDGGSRDSGGGHLTLTTRGHLTKGVTWLVTDLTWENKVIPNAISMGTLWEYVMRNTQKNKGAIFIVNIELSMINSSFKVAQFWDPVK